MQRNFFLLVAVAAVLGIFVGLSGYTFLFARGFSYASDDPATCVNCHVMRGNYDSWLASPHRSVTCNGCHTPHQPVDKYLVKAEHGVRHSLAFTFEEPQVIQIKAQSLAVVEGNCVDCHQETIAGTFLIEGEETRCAECHRGVAHTF